MATYKYSCNEERGEFHGHIEDENGKEVFSFHYPEFYEDENDGELIECATLIDSGHMKHTQDVEGLEDYLKSIGILHSGDELLSENEYAKGGVIKWQDVQIGDSARVKSENKMGLILKTYGRKFHLKFPNGNEKTYDASELEFFKDEDEFAEGGEIERGNVVVFKKDMKGNMAHRGRWKVVDVVYNEFGMPSYHLYSDSYGFSLDVEPSEVEKATFFAERFADGGDIGYIPMELEEKFAILSKWGGVNIRELIGILNAMIDSEITDNDLIINPTKNTRFQRERAIEKKIKEIWEKIEPQYKGDLKGYRYYSSLKELIGRNWIYENLLKNFKPYRKYQKFNDGGVMDVRMEDTVQRMDNSDFADISMYAKGGNLEDKIKKLLVAKESFDLPLEMAVYVPSTEKASQIIPKREFSKRIEDVQTYLSQLFGGFSSVKAQGGYESSEKGLIQEDVIKVVAFANRNGFEEKFNELMNRIVAWCKAWSQESIGFEFEGDLFYVSENAKFKNGGLFSREFKHYTKEATSQRKGVADEIMKDKDIALGYSYGGGLDYDEAMQRKMILKQSRSKNKPQPEFYRGYNKRYYKDEKPYSPIKADDLPLEKFLQSKYNKNKKS
jgi:hypothetical protein